MSWRQSKAALCAQHACWKLWHAVDPAAQVRPLLHCSTGQGQMLSAASGWACTVSRLHEAGHVLCQGSTRLGHGCKVTCCAHRVCRHIPGLRCGARQASGASQPQQGSGGRQAGTAGGAQGREEGQGGHRGSSSSAPAAHTCHDGSSSALSRGPCNPAAWTPGTEQVQYIMLKASCRSKAMLLRAVGRHDDYATLLLRTAVRWCCAGAG